MENYCVYCHTNIINNKKYIGLTKYGDNPNKRWRDGKGYKGTYFGNAIQKYGWNNFTHEIIENNLTKSNAGIKEKYYVELWNTNDSSYGYNCTSGGEVNFELTDECRKKLSIIHKGKKFSASHKKNHEMIMSSSEHKIKQSNSLKNSKALHKQLEELHKGNALRNKIYKSKEVICLETNIVYSSATEASKSISVNPSSITKCCRGEINSVKNFHYVYKNNYKN